MFELHIFLNLYLLASVWYYQMLYQSGWLAW